MTTPRGDAIQQEQSLDTGASQRNRLQAGQVRENQLFVGRDKSYNLTNYGEKFGSSLSIICDCHLTRADRVGIREVVAR